MPYHRVVAAPQDLPLGSEFPRPSPEQWHALVERVLDGASFERRLVSRTYDGRTIQPLYTAGDAPPPDAAGVPGVSTADTSVDGVPGPAWLRASTT